MAPPSANVELFDGKLIRPKQLKTIYHISMDLADIHAIPYVSRKIFCIISTSIHINPHQSTPFLDAGEKLGDKNFVLLHKQQYLR